MPSARLARTQASDPRPGQRQGRTQMSGECNLCGGPHAEAVCKTPISKEEPPTLRECREILKHAKDQLDVHWGMRPCVPAQKKVHDVIPRLTDEALERDEKRRLWLERLYDHCTALELRDSFGGLAKILAELDALTPAPQDKDCN